MKVVFTGKGEWDGIPIDRAALTAKGAQYGYHVANKVDRFTDYLVASRTNTQKARDALSMGVAVITYDAFQRLCETGKLGALSAPSAPPAIKSAPIDMAALEQLDGFGMF